MTPHQLTARTRWGVTATGVSGQHGATTEVKCSCIQRVQYAGRVGGTASLVSDNIAERSEFPKICLVSGRLVGRAGLMR